MAHRACRGVRLFVSAVLALVAYPLFAGVAHADAGYSIPEVDIDAVVDASGTVSVVEERVFDFAGTFSCVYWDLPLGAGPLGAREVKVVGAGQASEAGTAFASDAYRYYERGSADEAGTYDVAEAHDAAGAPVARVRLDFSATTTATRFWVAYELDGDVALWGDCGELYWGYLSDGWSVPSENVSCTVHLPAPDDEPVEQGALSVWQHCMSDAGELRIDDAQVTAYLPVVGAGQAAGLRVLFPAGWLAGLSARSEARRQAVAEEEAAREQAAAREREAYDGMRQTALAVGLAVGALALALAVALRAAWRKERTARFSRRYVRDVPSEEHPAVLDFVRNGSPGGARRMLATLMHLGGKGAVLLERSDHVFTDRNGRTKERRDYRLTRVPGVAGSCDDPVDVATLAFLFDWVAASVVARKERYRDADTVYFSDLVSVAAADPEAYAAQVGALDELVRARAAKRGLDDDAHPKSAVALVAVALASGMAGFVYPVLMHVCFPSSGVGETALSVVAGALFFSAALLFAYTAVKGRKRSQEALEIRARLEALGRWLEDFEDRGEELPQDADTWNRLLVMAVLLGDADGVAKRLDRALPQVAADPRFSETALWCGVGPGAPGAMRPFCASYDSAYAAAR